MPFGENNFLYIPSYYNLRPSEWSLFASQYLLAIQTRTNAYRHGVSHVHPLGKQIPKQLLQSAVADEKT